MRRTAAHAVLIRRSLEGVDDIRMIRQTQVIIAAKIDDRHAIANQVNALRRFDDTPGTPQTLL